MRSIAAADITVLAPDFYPSPHYTRYLRASAARHGVPIHWYGTGEQYTGWLQVQIHRLLDTLRALTTSHMLYTDSSDALFVAGLDEIAAVYEGLGSPEILMSVERDNMLCAGGWMGEVEAAVKALEWLRDWTQAEDVSNPQSRWRDAYARGQLAMLQADVDRDVFQVMDEPVEVIVSADPEWRNYDDSYPRVLRSAKTSWPCLLHFAGGFSHPQHGKLELIDPWMAELGYESLT